MPTLTAKQNGNYKVNGYTTLHVNVQPGGGGGTAASISYDNTISALTATNVQDAIDELASDISSISVPQPTTTTPAMDGVAAVGSEVRFARGDHVHPTDTSRVPTSRTVNGHALSSNVTLTASDVGALSDSTVIPTNTSDLNNDSGFITSADVPDASSTTPLMDGTASTGSEDDYARGDHRHPSDTAKVSKSGDTMTGSLEMECPTDTTSFKARAQNLTRDVVPSTSTYGGGYYMYDDSDNVIGDVAPYIRNSGEEGVRLVTLRNISGTLKWHELGIGVLANGDRVVTITEKAPWLDALGLGAATLTSISISLSSITGTLYVRKWGRVCQLYGSFGNGTAFSSATSGTTIGTLLAPYRPTIDTIIPVFGRTSGTWASATYYIFGLRISASSGAVQILGNQNNLRACQYLTLEGTFITST